MRYNMLTYLEDAGVNKHGKLLWKLKCDCGQTCVKIASAVRIGRTRSCGCLKKPVIVEHTGYANILCM